MLIFQAFTFALIYTSSLVFAYNDLDHGTIRCTRRVSTPIYNPQPPPSRIRLQHPRPPIIQIPRPIPVPIPAPQPVLASNMRYFSGSRDPSFSRDCLESHNRVRMSDYHAPAPPLVWDAKLAMYAQHWAITLANRASRIGPGQSKLQHSNGEYGENLFVVWNGNPSCRFAVESWYNEKRFYNRGLIIPNRSSSGHSFKDYGHYTQIMWRETKKVGCAYADGDGNGRFTVCEYFPHGNIVGKALY